MLLLRLLRLQPLWLAAAVSEIRRPQAVLEDWSITTFEGTQATWTKEEVTTRLINEEIRWNTLKGDSTSSAHFTRGAKKGVIYTKPRNDRGHASGSASSSRGGYANNNNNRGHAREGACRYCKNLGHWWRECWSKLRDWNPTSPTQEERRANVVTSGEDTKELVFIAGGALGGLAWLLDTGATQHMTPHAELLEDVSADAPSKRMVFGNQDSLEVNGRGTLRLAVDDSPMTINNVLVVPGLGANLLSVSQLTTKGMRVNIEGAVMTLSTSSGRFIGKAHQDGGLFKLVATPNLASAHAAVAKPSLGMWHNRFGHLSASTIRTMATQGVVHGIVTEFSTNEEVEKCSACLEGKMAMLMMEQGLWGFFDGTEKKPDNESNIAAWKKKDQKAFATLISRIGINLVSSERMCIKLEASAHEAWKRLETMHVNKTLHGKILARNAFYTLKMCAGESMHEYATRVEELGETFMDLGGTVTEEDWTLTLLCGLPEEWSTVITTLDSMQDTWTKEIVVGRLLHEESRRRQFANESEGAAMFSGGSSGKKSTWSKGATKKSSGGSDRSKRNTSNGSSKCHYCGKAGHLWRECRKRPSDWTPSRARNHEGNAHTASGDANDSRESIVLLAGDGTNTPSDAWFLDTGATQHMMHSASFLTNVGAPRDVTRVVFGNDKSLLVVGVGSTRLIVDGGPVDITNVLHVTGLKVNLLSVTQLAKKGVKVTIDDAKMNLFWKGKQFAQGVLNGELYQLKTHPRVASSNVAQGSKATLKVWHNRLAHANYDSVKELAIKGLAKGFDAATGDDEKGVCAASVEGKMAHKPFDSRTSPLAKDPLALVYMDVCGPMRHTSKGGVRFLLVMLDDATRMCWTRLLKAKGDVTKAIQESALEVCDDDKKRIKAIRTDGGGEFSNAELEKWMKSKGIKHDVTTPYTPQHNGAAERLNRTLVEAVRSLLQHSKLGNEWWGEASALAAWIRNCVPTKVLSGTTPFEAWTGTKLNLSRLRTFGCLCYYHVPDPLRHKLQPKARAAIYLGIAANERAWRVWDLGERRVVTSRDVVFDEDKFPTKEQPTPQLTIVLPTREEDELIEVPSQVEKEAENGGGENEESNDDVVEVPSTAATTSSTPSSLPLALTREQRIRRPNTKYTDYATVAVGELDEERAAYCFATLGDDPRTHTEALASPDAPLWKQAMEKELASIKENDVFELVDPPKGAYLVGCKWVLKKKLGANGSVERYKARLVAQGYTQREGEHYSETFALVAKATTLRVLLALAASLNLEVEQLDVCTAFLYGLLMEEVYMRQPPGYDDGSGRVWKLKRTLYSLKQSPRGWYKRIDDFLLQHGFARSECDSTLYVLEGEKQFVLLLYVDDLLLFSDSKDLIREVKQRLGAEFAMRDLGPVTYYLGMHVDRDRASGTIHLHQEKYVKGVVESFGMGNSKPVGTPLATGFSCLTGEEESTLDEPEGKLIHSLVGSLMYAAVSTRPDLAYAAGVLGRVVSNPHTEHVHAGGRVLRYLQGTANLGLVYEAGPIELKGYADLDYAGDPSTRKSTSGYVFTLLGAA
ncbi:unnamed protein product, partial [Closterium sp. NIES-54]